MGAGKWIADQVSMIREARRRQGHDLSRLQQGIVESVAAWDPLHEPASRKMLAEIQTALASSGRWTEQDEWRISTYFNSIITRPVEGEGHPYEVSVECDGQMLACKCPTLEGAYAFMRLYQAFIVDQFYSVGPPWASTGMFKS